MITPIVTYPLNGIEYEAEDAETYFATRSSGVFSAEGNMSISITGTWTVTISTGLAWIKNETLKGKSICISEPIAVALQNITTTGVHKTARIFLHFDKSVNKTTLVTRYSDDAVPTASTPVAPAVVRSGDVYELCLYSIDISGDKTNLTADAITDERLNDSVCGLMRDGVEHIPTDTLRSAFISKANQFQGELQNEYSEWLVTLRSMFEGTSDEVIQQIVNVMDKVGDQITQSMINSLDWGDD